MIRFWKNTHQNGYQELAVNFIEEDMQMVGNGEYRIRIYGPKLDRLKSLMSGPGNRFDILPSRKKTLIQRVFAK